MSTKRASIIEQIKCSNYQNTQDLINNYARAKLSNRTSLLDLYIAHCPHLNHLLELVDKGFRLKKFLNIGQISAIENKLSSKNLNIKDFISSSYCPQTYPNSAYYFMCLPIHRKYDEFWSLHKSENQYEGMLNNKRLHPLNNWLDFEIEGAPKNNVLIEEFDSVDKCWKYLKKIESIYVYLFSNNYISLDSYKKVIRLNPEQQISTIPMRLTMRSLYKPQDLSLLSDLKLYMASLEKSIFAQVEKNILNTSLPAPSQRSALYKV